MGLGGLTGGFGGFCCLLRGLTENRGFKWFFWWFS